jgi:hypothetical protein
MEMWIVEAVRAPAADLVDAPPVLLLLLRRRAYCVPYIPNLYARVVEVVRRGSTLVRACETAFSTYLLAAVGYSTASLNRAALRVAHLHFSHTHQHHTGTRKGAKGEAILAHSSISHAVLN